MNTKIIIAAARKVAEAVEKDRDHLVKVKHDFYAGTLPDTWNGLTVHDFACADFKIVKRVVTIFETGDRKPFCDGASLAPDTLLGVDLAPAYIIHDAVYEHKDEILAEWTDWTWDDLRALADMCLGQAMIQIGKAEGGVKGFAVSKAAYPYYWATRFLGGVYNRLAALCLVALILSLAGAGCQIPDGFELGDPPDIEVVPVAQVESVAQATP